MQKGKVYDYVVVLKNNNKTTIEKTAWLLSYLSLLPMGIQIYLTPKAVLNYILQIGRAHV